MTSRKIRPRNITLTNWLDAPHNRISFQRVRELAPTALIRNRGGLIARLPANPVDLGSLRVPTAGGGTAAWVKRLERTQCDAICVVHDGAVVFERYFNGMQDDTPHLLMSVSKSFCGAALGIAVGRGLIRADDLVCDVAPEFAGTSLDGATVQHVIDMTAGTEFTEDYEVYADPDGDDPLLEYERQAGYRPLGNREAVGTLAHFRTYGTAFAHGTEFNYRSPLTNAAARLVEIANDARYPDVVSRDLWAPLGQEHDADIMLDCVGNAVVEGGMSCSLRDLARFGLAYLQGGMLDGRQVIPSAWVDDTRLGTDDAERAFLAGPADDDTRGWSMYRNAFWVIQRGEVFSGLGIFGQYCWVHRPSNTVIARFSTYPDALPTETSTETLTGFEHVAAFLQG